MRAIHAENADSAREAAVQHVDVQVARARGGGESAQEGEPENQGPRQRIDPDDPAVKEIPQDDLDGGERKHGPEDEAEERSLDPPGPASQAGGFPGA